MHSCGSLPLSMLAASRSRFRRAASETSVFEPGFPAICIDECEVWQSVQPTSLRQCSPRRKLLWSSLPAWHPRHVSEVSFDDFVLNEMIFLDRKSTRLNSSHSQISYAVFCLKKKKNTK